MTSILKVDNIRDSSDNQAISISNGVVTFANDVIPTDNVSDLGTSYSRYKDLFLSGGVYLGGTGSANYLDDYEEGTFTHTVSNFSTAISSGWTTGRYVKIGNKVWIHGVIVANSGTVSSGVQIGGLPFTVVAGSQGFSAVMYSGNIATSIYGVNNIKPIQRVNPGGNVMDTEVSSGTGGINLVYSAHYTV